MHDFGLEPKPPRWALDAGLPEPYAQETFTEYVTRLGFVADELLIELTERTICLANLRLATKLQYSMPQEFDRHVQRLVRLHIPRERQAEVVNSAIMLWGDRFRRPVAVA